MFGGILTNKIRVVSPQLVVQFLRVRLVDGGPEAAAPRDHRVDVLGGGRPRVISVVIKCAERAGSTATKFIFISGQPYV